MANKFCLNCGAQEIPKAKFCGSCGQRTGAIVTGTSEFDVPEIPSAPSRRTIQTKSVTVIAVIVALVCAVGVSVSLAMNQTSSMRLDGKSGSQILEMFYEDGFCENLENPGSFEDFGWMFANGSACQAAGGEGEFVNIYTDLTPERVESMVAEDEEEYFVYVTGKNWVIQIEDTQSVLAQSIADTYGGELRY
jgi:hypothetical protein